MRVEDKEKGERPAAWLSMDLSGKATGDDKENDENISKLLEGSNAPKSLIARVIKE